MDNFGVTFSMYLFSLWKVYIAYSYFAFSEFSFLYANTVILLATATSYFVSLILYPFINKIKFLIRFRKSKNYKKANSLYNKYGFYILSLLAPVLVGTPVFVLISKEFKQSNVKIALALFLSVLFYGVVIYYLGSFMRLKFS